MALVRPRAEHREALKLIYERYGEQEFLQREVRDVVSKSIFKKLCNYDFIIKDGKHMLRTPHSNPEKYDHSHLVNIWRLNLNDGLVKKYVKGSYNWEK
jgi:hypothetical protein